MTKSTEKIKLIPKGPYCYFGSKAPHDPNFKLCPFYQIKNNLVFCEYLKKDSNDLFLLEDQVKECYEND